MTRQAFGPAEYRKSAKSLVASYCKSDLFYYEVSWKHNNYSKNEYIIGRGTLLIFQARVFNYMLLQKMTESDKKVVSSNVLSSVLLLDTGQLNHKKFVHRHDQHSLFKQN